MSRSPKRALALIAKAKIVGVGVFCHSPGTSSRMFKFVINPSVRQDFSGPAKGEYTASGINDAERWFDGYLTGWYACIASLTEGKNGN